jgi:hypothetical protein
LLLHPPPTTPPFYSDTHLLAKLLSDSNNQIVWLTDCLLSTYRTVVELNSNENTFPFGCDVTVDELHNAFRSWMDVKNRQDLMYKSIVHFHRGLKSILQLQHHSSTTATATPILMIPDDVNSGTSFVLEWHQVESAILKTRLGLDPFDPDTLENSPLRRVCNNNNTHVSYS